MLFREIAGINETRLKLINTVKDNRISHALLFLGQPGSGKMALAIAYSQYIACENRGENDSCGICPSCLKYSKLIHPDLHFVYPVVRTTKFTKPVSDDYLSEWRKYLLSTNYHSLEEWTDLIAGDNQQAGIYAQESQEIIRKLNLKTFESEYKVMIIWMPERMNVVASNKLLKMIEEPPAKTLFLLVTENEEEILTTIRSRTQLVKIPRITEEELFDELKKKHPNASDTFLREAAHLSNGNYNTAIDILRENDSGDKKSLFFDLFTELMRLCYSAKVIELMQWVDKAAQMGREKQKIFFNYSLRLLRENFILNLVPNEKHKLVFLANEEAEFAKKFAQFIHKNNIFQLMEEFNNASIHIERNANDKIVFLDMTLNIIKLLKIPNN